MTPFRRRTRGWGAVRPALVVPLAVLGWLVVGASCATPVGEATPAVPRLSAGPATPAVASQVPASVAPSPEAARPTPPAGFPVFPGASPAALPADDPGVAARWITEEVGSAPYDFYVAALPAAGFAVLGSYPGGAGAVIVFEAAGTAWQVVVSPDGDRLLVTLRLDRP